MHDIKWSVTACTCMGNRAMSETAPEWFHVAVACQSCQLADGTASRPYLEVGNGGTLYHQAVIPSYILNCSETQFGIIHHWEIYVRNSACDDERRRRRQECESESSVAIELSFDLQVLRPITERDTDGGDCYRVVGNHSVVACMLQRNGLYKIAPSAEHNIPFQPGDVIGFYVKTTVGESDVDTNIGVSELTIRGAGSEFTNELVWYTANVEPAMVTNQDGYCPNSRNDMLDCFLSTPLFISSKTVTIL